MPNLVTLPTISTPFHEIFSRPEQCDQMVRSLIQHSVICISKNLPNCLIMLTNCAKHKISTQNWPKTLKICQIWSPWSQSQSFWCSNRVKKFFSVVHFLFFFWGEAPGNPHGLDSLLGRACEGSWGRQGPSKARGGPQVPSKVLEAHRDLRRPRGSHRSLGAPRCLERSLGAPRALSIAHCGTLPW